MRKQTNNRGVVLRAVGHVAFAATVIALLLSPGFYYLARTGSFKAGRHAVCGMDAPDAQKVALQDVALNADYWRDQQVAISGTLSYSPALETFFLRDGALSLPVDMTDCQDIGSYRTGQTLVAVRGTIAEDDRGGQVLVAGDVRDTYPPVLRTAFTAGAIGSLIVLALILHGIIVAIRWLLTRIGAKKPKEGPSDDELRGKSAGMMLFAGIYAPFVWAANPFLGALCHATAVATGWKGLRSGKRVVAYVGLALCGAGFIAMALLSLALGWFEKPPFFDPFATSIDTSTIAASGNETLERKAYVSPKFAFSIHPPKGWVADDTGASGVQVVFTGPEQGMTQNAPFHPQLKVSTISASGVKAKSVDDIIDIFVGAAGKTLKDVSSTRETHQLAGGRIDARLVDVTYVDKDVPTRSLALFTMRGDVVYVVGADMPAEKWGANAAVVRDALLTFHDWTPTFAACLRARGAAMYGTSTCADCIAQKEMFTDGAEGLPYVECATEDGTGTTDACRSKNIDKYPTWILPDGSRLTGVMPLETLSIGAKCPLPPAAK